MKSRSEASGPGPEGSLPPEAFALLEKLANWSLQNKEIVGRLEGVCPSFTIVLVLILYSFHKFDLVTI